jgi:monomeric isocitrate dehydrogenase
MPRALQILADEDVKYELIRRIPKSATADSDRRDWMVKLAIERARDEAVEVFFCEQRANGTSSDDRA